MNLRERVPPRVVLKFYFYTTFASFGFAMPVWVIFLKAKGLTLGQIGLLEGTYTAVMIAAETPSGYLGDRIGRRNAMLVSTLVSAVTALGFGVVETFAGFLVLYGVRGVGATFRSGTASAWLYDVLESELDSDEFDTYFGRSRAYGQVGTAIMTAVAGPLAAVNLFYPFVATAAVNALASGVVYSFPDVGEGESDEPFTVSDAVSVVRTELSKPSMRTFVLYTVFFYAIISGVFLFIQPASLAIGVELEQVGFVYSGLAVVSAFAGYFAGDVADVVGFRTWIHAVPPILAVVFMLVGVFPVAAIPAFFVMKIAGEVTGPIRGQYLNDHTESVGRATVLSAVSMVLSLLLVPINSFAGALGDVVGPTTAIAVLGGVLFVGTVGTLLVDAPVKATEDRPTAAGD